MGLSGAFFKALQDISGKNHVAREMEERLCYAYDATGKTHLPDVVVFPGSEQEIADILKLASREKCIVVPRGTGSGMTGGSVPIYGGLVLVTTRMNHILSVDEANLVARVQPGVIVADLHKEVESRGLFYPPDPSSASICTIGGNVAECAGGPRAVKYGVTRDYVLGLRAVLPSGNIIRTGTATAKGVAGYDLTRLIVGSEGTLAVVTEIILKLLPRPKAVRTMAALFDSATRAAQAVSTVMKKAVLPRCVEYLDEGSLNLVRDRLSFPIPHDARALLIIELDGDPVSVSSDTGRVEEICRTGHALEVRVAETEAEAIRLWEARKALSPVMFKIAPHKINEDIVVPIDKIPELVAVTDRIEKATGLKVVSFGHAGDGNIHCNIMYDRSDPAQALKSEQAVSDLFHATLDLGGTITGEHGVGITKKKYLPREIDAVQMELMKGIKKVFDPFNILNPGKIFD